MPPGAIDPVFIIVGVVRVLGVSVAVDSHFLEVERLANVRVVHDCVKHTNIAISSFLRPCKYVPCIFRLLLIKAWCRMSRCIGNNIFPKVLGNDLGS